MIVVGAAGGKALWYLTRGTGIVALLLLTAVLLLGIASTLRWRTKRWPRFVVADLHKNLTLLSIVFVVIHVVTTVVDGFAPISLVDAIVPFASPYRPIWLGLGALSFDLLLALVVTSLLRARLGYRLWRWVHWLAYAAWPVALVHSLGTGSDGRVGWLAALALACIALVGLALLVRLVRSAVPARLRIAGGVGTLAAAALVLGWYSTGPLQPGWAARSGTPARLVRSPSASSTARAIAFRSALPQTFNDSLDARLARSDDGVGDVGVAISGNVRGASVEGVLGLTLWGAATEEGGVSMTTSRVTFSPVGVRPYSGTVIALSGDHVVAELTNASGQPLRLTIELRIDSQTQTVTGSVHGEHA
jgi:methionine sulfoxide reductase heme-binding subunit